VKLSDDIPGGDRYAAHVAREHRCGRSFREILDDSYLRPLSSECRRRLLDRPELIRAVVVDTGLVKRR
jgi:hypothetical protein